MGKLMQRRDKIKAESRALVASKHSPWHPDAREHPEAVELKTPGYLPLDQRPIALMENRVTHFVGDCAKQVLAGLKAYGKRYEEAKAAADPDDVPPWQPREAYLVCQAAALAKTKDGDEVLTFADRQDFNNALYALQEQGIKVQSTDAKDPSPFDSV